MSVRVVARASLTAHPDEPLAVRQTVALDGVCVRQTGVGEAHQLALVVATVGLCYRLFQLVATSRRGGLGDGLSREHAHRAAVFGESTSPKHVGV